jgi:hypothetical protein
LCAAHNVGGLNFDDYHNKYVIEQTWGNGI